MHRCMTVVLCRQYVPCAQAKPVLHAGFRVVMAKSGIGCPLTVAYECSHLAVPRLRSTTIQVFNASHVCHG